MATAADAAAAAVFIFFPAYFTRITPCQAGFPKICLGLLQKVFLQMAVKKNLKG